MKKQIISFSVLFIIALAFASCGNKSSSAQSEPTATDQTAVDTTGASQSMAAVYQCPMKCEGDKTYDQPGKCPKCGMDLKEVENHEGHNH